MLVKCDHFTVKQYGIATYKVIGNERIALGEYSTLNKAFHVLDMIETLVEHKSNHLFYMPQDEDVKV